MKEKILKLRKQGKSYREIEKELKCSRSLIYYYVNPNGKQRVCERQRKNRFHKREYFKKLLGKKCSKCGYDKCLAALQFHHKNPKNKKFEITEAIWNKVKASDKEIKKEVKKCTLLCANCHAELHYPNL